MHDTSDVSLWGVLQYCNVQSSYQVDASYLLPVKYVQRVIKRCDYDKLMICFSANHRL